LALIDASQYGLVLVCAEIACPKEVDHASARISIQGPGVNHCDGLGQRNNFIKEPGLFDSSSLKS
jgi:hypothetical protein